MLKISSELSRTAPSDRPTDGAIDRAFSDAIVFFHAALAAHLGMSVADWKCLGLLEQHGKMTAGRLAELSGFTTGAVTGIVDRLVRRGYARREPNPADRRSVIVCPGSTEPVQKRIRPIFASLRRAMEGVTHNYTATEMKTVQSWLSQTAQALRGETRKLKTASAKKDGTNVGLSVPGGQ